MALKNRFLKCKKKKTEKIILHFKLNSDKDGNRTNELPK